MTIESALQELIKKVSDAQSQIDNLVLQVKTLEHQKAEAREETEHTLLQLQQLQEEFEQLYRSAGKERVMTLESELSEQELQLDQMQEELEHQFLSNQQQKDLLDTYVSQEERFQHILHKILQAQTPDIVSKQQHHLKGSLKKVQSKRDNAGMQPKYD